MMHLPVPSPRLRSQAGGGMLTIVATLGVLLVLVQGTLYYKAKGSAKFLGSEKSKVLAQQLAEAGVEDNIADLGRRAIRVRAGMIDSVTYAGKPFGNGAYTTRLTTLATGAAADTVELVSTGSVGKASQSVRTRLKLNKVMDTTRAITPVTVPFDSVATQSASVPVIGTKLVPADIASIPDMATTQSYADCLKKGKNGRCNLCHLPPGNPANTRTITVSVNSVGTHVNHHGDYIAPDNASECDLYDPKTVPDTTYKTVTQQVHTTVNHIRLDTALSIDTVVRVQFLTWR